MSLREEITATQDVVEAYKCALCKDTGMTFDDTGHNRVATTCVCRRHAALEQSMRRAGLPDRYRDASLANYDLKVSMAAVVGHAAATRFVQEWPLTDFRGLLFTGSVGTANAPGGRHPARAGAGEGCDRTLCGLRHAA